LSTFNRDWTIRVNISSDAASSGRPNPFDGLLQSRQRILAERCRIPMIVFHMRRENLSVVPGLPGQVFRLSLAPHWWYPLIDPCHTERIAKLSTLIGVKTSA